MKQRGIDPKTPMPIELVEQYLPSLLVAGKLGNLITLEDCIGLCGLTEEEVFALAEHEHLSEICAAALAQYLLSQEHGSEKVRDVIVDDIRQAQRKGDKQHVLTLLHVLHHFLKSHPEAEPSQHPWSKRRGQSRWRTRARANEVIE